jgi:hypothetical protein
LPVKSAYYRLRLLEESIRVERENLTVLGELEQLAGQQPAAGRATLQDVLRAQIEQERLKTQIDNLEDSRGHAGGRAQGSARAIISFIVALLLDPQSAYGLPPFQQPSSPFTHNTVH